MRRLLLSFLLALSSATVLAEEPPRLEAEARRAFDAGSFRQAGEKYARAADAPALTPERRADLLLQSAWSYYIAGNRRIAREALRSAFTARPDLRVHPDFYSPEFSKIAQSIRSELAGSSLAAVEPGEAKRTARKKLDAGNAEAALRELQQAAASNDPEVHRLLAEAYDRLGRGPEADAARRRASEIESGLVTASPLSGPSPAGEPPVSPPPSVAAIVDSARKLFESGDAPGAEGLARRAAEVEPRNADVRRLLADIALAAGRDSDAEREFTAAAASDPGDPRAAFGLALLAERQGKWNTAASQYRRALELDPKSVSSALGLGRAMDELKDRTAARLAYGRAIEIDPQSAQARNDSGVSLFRAGEPDRAIEELLEAVRLAPESAVHRENLGRAYRKKQAWAEAERELAEAARLAPGEVGVWSVLGSVRLQQKRPAEAATAFASALELEPSSEDAAAGLAIALSDAGKLAEAEDALARILELRPESVVLWNNLGVVRARRGALPAAADAFRKALDLDNAFVAARSNLARTEQLLAVDRAGA